MSARLRVPSLPRLAMLSVFSLAVSTWSVAGRAQSESARDAARLFDEGRALQKSGHYEEACARFDASETLEPAVGTLLNLADCAERRAATATAWQRYREAAVLARRIADPEREAVAKRGAEALEGNLSKMILLPPPHALPNAAVVQRDGIVVSTGDLAVPVAVDPGVHRVDVAAPGYKPWSTSVTIGPGPIVVAVDLSALEIEAPPARVEPQTPVARPVDLSVPSEPPREPPPVVHSRGPWAWVAGGTGIALLGVGTYFAFRSRSVWSDVTAVCPGGRCPDQKTADALSPRQEEAQRDATIGTVGLAVGVIAVVAGVVLYLLDKPHAVTSAGPRLTGAPSTHGGLALGSLTLE